MSDDTVESLPEPSELCEFVAEGLERVEREGPAALAAICDEHPEHAEALRRRIRSLADVGLVDDGRVFGHYRVVRTLGRGGMGVVYLARDTRLDRLVALKALPERLVPHERARLRLQREIRAVAQLRHPSILPIWDVGEEAGAPYFTMEWVEGETLAQLLESARATGLPAEHLSAADLHSPDGSRTWIEAACRLVLSVAEGLEHAHQHGVVHRDVKPQNIMVGVDGRARLFDFGLARVEGEAALTLTGDLAGTPFYLSPEAASARTRGLDARTDVYSLGVTLFELLTLRVPFTGRTTEEVLRQIASREPPLPRRHNAEVSRDLETICLTAMEKDPARRYQSAGALADDLRRLLEFRPVRARPVGPLVRGLRVARRNKALASSVLLSVLVLAGTPLLLWQSNRAIARQRDAATEAAAVAQAESERAQQQTDLALRESERARQQTELAVAASMRAQEQTDLALAESQRATAEAAEAERARGEAEQARLLADRAAADAGRASAAKAKAVDFLLALLIPASPFEVDHDLEVVDLLRRGAAGVGEALHEETRLQASVRQALGNAFMGLGEYGAAQEQFEAAWELVATENDAALDDSLAVSMNNLVAIHTRNGRLDLARSVGEKALEVNARLYGERSFEVSDVLNNLAIVAARAGDKGEAEAIFRHVLALRIDLLGEQSRVVAETRYNLGLVLDPGTSDEAEQLFRQALEVQRRVLPADDPITAMTLGGLAELYHNRGDSERAIATQREGLDMLRARLGELHPDVATASVRLAFMHIKVEQYDLAEPLLRAAQESYGRTFPAGHPRRVAALRWLASVLAALERPGDAEPFLEQAVEEQLRVDPSDRTELTTLLTMQVDLLRRLERPEEAAALLSAHPELTWPVEGSATP